MATLADEIEIISVLQKAVTAAVAASDNSALPVSYLDKDFTKPSDQKWLEIVHIPNNRTGSYWGNQKDHRGILRLVLHWPNDGDGIYPPLELLGSITDYFDKNRVLSGVKIYDIPDYTGALREGDETLYPVSIWYMSFRN